MLTILRKFFGVLALVWVLLFAFGIVSCMFDPKAGGTILALVLMTVFVGVPSCVIWTVLKLVQGKKTT